MEKKAYIFGAGKNGIQLYEYIKSINLLLLHTGGVRIKAFIDNDISKQGKDIDGLRCISLDEAIDEGAHNDLIIVSPCQNNEIEKQLEKQSFKKTICLGAFLENASRIKNFIPVFHEKASYKYLVPFEDYESPYPNISEVCESEKELFDRDKHLLGININLDRQLELMKEMEGINKPIWSNKSDKKYRYYYNNPWFEMVDANVLYYMIQIVKPKRIIEIGSGFSTAAMLDINEKYFNNNIKIFSIDPDANRLKSLLKDSDNIPIYEKKLQSIPVSFFESLEENDILFIDSSHVSKFNSDVNYLFFEILPRLSKGVYVHFHDIPYPFIYPREWIYEGRAYTERYILRAFLMNNTEYSIQFWCDMIQQKCKTDITNSFLGSAASSIYIKKEL